MTVHRSWWLTGTALLLLVLAAGCTAPVGVGAPAPAPIPGETADVLYFWGEGCHACHAVTPFVDELAREHPGVRFEEIETYGNETNTSRYYAVNGALNYTQRGLPEAVADGRAFFGEAEIRNGLPGAVRAVEARR
ncbi:MAG: thioredoxin family protein [Methanospirillum sp.]